MASSTKADRSGLKNARSNAADGILDITSSQILVVAAESSSSLYAQRLLENWQNEGRKVNAYGVGSKAMEKMGFECIGYAEDMAVMGFQEVLAHYKDIKKVYDKILDRVDNKKPRFALLLDYPGFNLKLAKDLKGRGVTVIYYISPQLWAWKKSRIKSVQKYVDKMLVLFPFEKPFYEKHGVEVDFVGHPLLDELDPTLFDTNEVQFQRQRYGINKEDVLLGLMPGSRRSELKYHIETQIEVAKKLILEKPGLKVALFVAPGVSKEELKRQIPHLDFPLIFIQDEPFKMISLADVILCASGTATLMVGLLLKPMVIMYKMNFITSLIMKAVVRSTKYFGMINLILDKEVAPEFFQERASVKQLCKTLLPMVTSSKTREEIKTELAMAQQLLGDKGATQRVKKILDEYLYQLG